MSIISTNAIIHLTGNNASNNNLFDYKPNILKLITNYPNKEPLEVEDVNGIFDDEKTLDTVTDVKSENVFILGITELLIARKYISTNKKNTDMFKQLGGDDLKGDEKLEEVNYEIEFELKENYLENPLNKKIIFQFDKYADFDKAELYFNNEKTTDKVVKVKTDIFIELTNSYVISNVNTFRLRLYSKANKEAPRLLRAFSSLNYYATTGYNLINVFIDNNKMDFMKNKISRYCVANQEMELKILDIDNEIQNMFNDTADKKIARFRIGTPITIQQLIGDGRVDEINTSIKEFSFNNKTHTLDIKCGKYNGEFNNAGINSITVTKQTSLADLLNKLKNIKDIANTTDDGVFTKLNVNQKMLDVIFSATNSEFNTSTSFPIKDFSYNANNSFNLIKDICTLKSIDIYNCLYSNGFKKIKFKNQFIINKNKADDKPSKIILYKDISDSNDKEYTATELKPNKNNNIVGGIEYINDIQHTFRAITYKKLDGTTDSQSYSLVPKNKALHVDKKESFSLFGNVNNDVLRNGVYLQNNKDYDYYVIPTDKRYNNTVSLLKANNTLIDSINNPSGIPADTILVNKDKYFNIIAIEKGDSSNLTKPDDLINLEDVQGIRHYTLDNITLTENDQTTIRKEKENEIEKAKVSVVEIKLEDNDIFTLKNKKIKDTTIYDLFLDANGVQNDNQIQENLKALLKKSGFELFGIGNQYNTVNSYYSQEHELESTPNKIDKHQNVDYINSKITYWQDIQERLTDSEDVKKEDVYFEINRMQIRKDDDEYNKELNNITIKNNKNNYIGAFNDINNRNKIKVDYFIDHTTDTVKRYTIIIRIAFINIIYTEINSKLKDGVTKKLIFKEIERRPILQDGTNNYIDVKNTGPMGVINYGETITRTYTYNLNKHVELVNMNDVNLSDSFDNFYNNHLKLYNFNWKEGESKYDEIYQTIYIRENDIQSDRDIDKRFEFKGYSDRRNTYKYTVQLECVDVNGNKTTFEPYNITAGSSIKVDGDYLPYEIMDYYKALRKRYFDVIKDDASMKVGVMMVINKSDDFRRVSYIMQNINLGPFGIGDLIEKKHNTKLNEDGNFVYVIDNELITNYKEYDGNERFISDIKVNKIQEFEKNGRSIIKFKCVVNEETRKYFDNPISYDNKIYFVYQMTYNYENGAHWYEIEAVENTFIKENEEK